MYRRPNQLRRLVVVRSAVHPWYACAWFIRTAPRAAVRHSVGTVGSVFPSSVCASREARMSRPNLISSSVYTVFVSRDLLASHLTALSATLCTVSIYILERTPDECACELRELLTSILLVYIRLQSADLWVPNAFPSMGNHCKSCTMLTLSCFC